MLLSITLLHTEQINYTTPGFTDFDSTAFGNAFLESRLSAAARQANTRLRYCMRLCSAFFDIVTRDHVNEEADCACFRFVFFSIFIFVTKKKNILFSHN